MRSLAACSSCSWSNFAESCSRQNFKKGAQSRLRRYAAHLHVTSHPSRLEDLSSRVVDTLRLIECEGWLANRSSESTVGCPPSWLRILAKLRWTTSAWIVERRLVAKIFPRWNPLTSWMRQIEEFQRAVVRRFC